MVSKGEDGNFNLGISTPQSGFVSSRTMDNSTHLREFWRYSCFQRKSSLGRSLFTVQTFLTRGKNKTHVSGGLVSEAL